MKSDLEGLFRLQLSKENMELTCIKNYTYGKLLQNNAKCLSDKCSQFIWKNNKKEKQRDTLIGWVKV